MTTQCIVYQHTPPHDGITRTYIVRPVPWARHIKAFRQHGERVTVDPPQPLESWLRRGLSAQEWDALAPEWAETAEQFMVRVHQLSVPADATDVSVRREADIPPYDSDFRDALTPQLTYDLARARDLWRDKMRRARVPMLAALDVAYQRADEAGDGEAKHRIAAEKQVLRDVTDDPRIASAKDIDALRAVWPDCLR